MKKATLLTLAATVAIAAGIPSLALWHQKEALGDRLQTTYGISLA